jgi:hypothetical protein
MCLYLADFLFNHTFNVIYQMLNKETVEKHTVRNVKPGRKREKGRGWHGEGMPRTNEIKGRK